MGRAFVYVILGGGVAAGYAALEFSRRGISPGDLCVISEEPVVPYERPALSKGFLLPESPARLPSFHTCVGANDERLTPKWYQEHELQNKLTENMAAAMRGANHMLDKRCALKDKKGHAMNEMYWTKNNFDSEASMDILSRQKRRGSLENLPLLFPTSIRENMPWNDDTFRGIELVLGTRVKCADVRRKTLLTATGETISYNILIIATGARALKLEEFGVKGSEADNVCYLRDLADANRLVSVMQSNVGGNAVVIGGGYIGMECAASLVINKINVTMVFPEAHCMARLFTPKIAEYYEEYYKSRGVNFIKGTVLSSFENNADGKVTAVILRDGTQITTDMVVVGIGIRPNTSLFEGQLNMEKGGIKVNGRLQTSNNSVYAVGDVAAFPVKLFGETRRLEHVDSARQSAKYAVAAIMAPDKTADFNYLPFFYSRVFSLSWQFYGDNVGGVAHYGDFSGGTFGAYWVNKGQIVGAFLEGGNKDEYEAIAKTTRFKPMVQDMAELERLGLDFALQVCQEQEHISAAKADLIVERPIYTWHATAGVIVATSIAAFAYWYGRRRRRW